MAKRKSSTELDSTYILKIVLYLILGSEWLKILTHSGVQIPLPIGALVGVIVASHEKFQIDRKIEYALILLAMFIGFWVPLGIVVSI